MLKEILCKKRIDKVKHIKSEPWSMQELDRVLNSLQRGKCRDPQGFINELFEEIYSPHGEQDKGHTRNSRNDDKCEHCNDT